MKNSTNISVIGKVILSVLAMSGIVTLAVLMPGIVHGIRMGRKLKRLIGEKTIYFEIEKLKKRGLIKQRKHSAGETYELSSKGKILSFQKGIIPYEWSPEIQSKTWDGNWRLVIFDVQEKDRTLRNTLRKSIQQYGFIYLQQSIWAYPYPCDDFIQTLKDVLGLKSSVVYVKAGYVEGDALLVRHFKLKKK